jgi:pSer/pThr/pTyr-binding forkhead associated (FHA) protein
MQRESGGRPCRSAADVVIGSEPHPARLPGELATPPAAPGAASSVRQAPPRRRLERLRQPPPRPPAPPSSTPPLAILLVKNGQLRGERLLVRSPVVNLGRASYNDLKLPDPSVSAGHAKLQLREGVWLLSDLGFTSGSRIDGEPASGEMPLAPGATIRLGEVELLFEPRDPPVRRAAGSSTPEANAAADVFAELEAVRRRQPLPAPRRRLWSMLLVAGTLLGALLLAGYLFLG